MDLFFAAVPIASLIFVMTKKNGLPSTVAFALAALLTYLVRISYFKTSPNLAHAAVMNGLLQALTPISILCGAGTLWCHGHAKPMARRCFPESSGTIDDCWLVIHLFDRGGQRLRHSGCVSRSNPCRAGVSTAACRRSLSDHECGADFVWSGRHTNLVRLG